MQGVPRRVIGNRMGPRASPKVTGRADAVTTDLLLGGSHDLEHPALLFAD
jgi:hypothetical protein